MNEKKKIAFVSFEESEMEDLRASAARSPQERYEYLLLLRKIVRQSGQVPIDVDELDQDYILLKKKDQLINNINNQDSLS